MKLEFLLPFMLAAMLCVTAVAHGTGIERSPFPIEELAFAANKEFDSFRLLLREKSRSELRSIEFLDFQRGLGTMFSLKMMKIFGEEELISRAKSFIASEVPKVRIKAWPNINQATGPITLTAKRPVRFYDLETFKNNPSVLPFVVDFRLIDFSCERSIVGLWILSVYRSVPFPSQENCLLEKVETAWKGCSIQIFPERDPDREKWVVFEKLLGEFVSDWVIACSDN